MRAAWAVDSYSGEADHPRPMLPASPDEARVYDLDIGKDPDDTCVAVMVALAPERFQPTLMITSDETATLGRARFLAAVLATTDAGRRVPVAAGLPSALRRDDSLVEQAGLIPRSGGDFHRDGVERLIDVLDRHARTRYFGLGALTNLAAALARRPDLAARIDLTQMGPALASSYRRTTPQYNARIDPVAFSSVLGAVARPTLLLSHVSWGRFELPAGGRQQVGLYPDDPLGQALFASAHPAHRLLARHLAVWVESGKACSIMHDPLTVLSRLEEGLVDYEEATLHLSSDGFADLAPSHGSAALPARLSVRADYRAARRAIAAALLPGEDAARIGDAWGVYSSTH